MAYEEEQRGLRSIMECLTRVLDESLRSSDRGDALGEARIAAMEAAVHIVAAATERDDRNNSAAIERAREALASTRATVVAMTCAVRSLQGRSRAAGL
ncbi:hypothetical protein [Streptomyces sp. NPDC015350]|uniref:hypothetical protein n=1 Tax=Streptomyces sp. NPDC015350 TaxID=3364955 RepID=UPI0036FB2CA6